MVVLEILALLSIFLMLGLGIAYRAQTYPDGNGEGFITNPKITICSLASLGIWVAYIISSII